MKSVSLRTNCMISLGEVFEIVKLMEAENKMVVSRDWGKEEIDVIVQLVLSSSYFKMSKF